MAAAKTPSSVICPSCGVRNAPSSNATRCASCGAPMVSEALPPVRGAAIERGPLPRQGGGFSLVWCAVALLVQSVLTAALVIGLPMVVSVFDFEGSNGMVVVIPVLFLGGMLLGMISPGKTFAEPVVASFLVLIPTVLYLWRGQTVRVMPFFMYAIFGLIGVLFTLVGTYLGERIQMGPPPKAAD